MQRHTINADHLRRHDTQDMTAYFPMMELEYVHKK
jgi:hypothetical protein